jgi:hypothetical protein
MGDHDTCLATAPTVIAHFSSNFEVPPKVFEKTTKQWRRL